jgi:hypothetical protein
LDARSAPLRGQNRPDKWGQSKNREIQTDFEQRVFTLTPYIIDCHNRSAEGYAASGFSLEDYDSVMKGTNFGAVVVPNSSISSTLYLVIAHKTDPAIHMPPHHEDALAKGRGPALIAEQIDTIGAWIDQGAKDN